MSTPESSIGTPSILNSDSELLAGVTGRVFAGEGIGAIEGSRWYNSAAYEVDPEQLMIDPRESGDRTFISILVDILAYMSYHQRGCPSNETGRNVQAPLNLGKTLIIGNGIGLEQSVLARYPGASIDGKIHTTNLFEAEYASFKKLIPTLYRRQVPHVGGLERLIELWMQNVRFNTIFGLRSFGNADLRHNPAILDQWLNTISALQQSGDYMLISPFTPAMIPILRRAWGKQPDEEIFRRGFSLPEVKEVLKQNNYQLAYCAPYCHASLLSQFFGKQLDLNFSANEQQLIDLYRYGHIDYTDRGRYPLVYENLNAGDVITHWMVLGRKK